MGYIADLSRYDPLEAVDQFPDGVILNIEDPGFAAKRDRAVSKGIPWGTYSWVYPGQGPQAAQRAHDAGTGPLGAWLDYEQEGVSPSDLQLALSKADQLGFKIGVYTYLYIWPSVSGVVGDHPIWMAYYPGANDGTYQDAYSNDARKAGALLHQFTSSNGSRDLSVVLDPTRWSAWTGSGDDEMTPDDWSKLGTWMQESEARIEKHVDDVVDKKIGTWLHNLEDHILAALKK